MRLHVRFIQRRYQSTTSEIHVVRSAVPLLMTCFEFHTLAHHTVTTRQWNEWICCCCTHHIRYIAINNIIIRLAYVAKYTRVWLMISDNNERAAQHGMMEEREMWAGYQWKNKSLKCHGFGFSLFCISNNLMTRWHKTRKTCKYFFRVCEFFRE